MTAAFDVLVVCEGNLCRSPLAERLLRARLGDASQVRVSSAGTNAVVGAAMDPMAAAELTRLGGDPAGAAGRQLTPELIRDADLVLTATRLQRSYVVGLAPAALKRTFTLLELAVLLDERPWTRGGQDPPEDPRVVMALAADWRSTVSSRGDALDIPDPIGRSAEVHRTAAEVADMATQVIADFLRGDLHE